MVGLQQSEKHRIDCVISVDNNLLEHINAISQFLELDSRVLPCFSRMLIVSL